LQARKPVKIATVIEAGFDAASKPGDCRMMDEDGSAGLDSTGLGLVRGEASGELLFVEQFVPPQALVIFGAGPDAAPVVEAAKALGWHVTVVGAHPATDLSGRFASADVLRVTSSDDPTEGVELPPDAAVVLMTHNFARDIRILSSLPKTLRYLGILGPRHRTDEVLAELPAEARPDTLFAPIGLDVGAETPQEIALSIIAEIQTVMRGTAGGSLRDRPGPIHLDRPDAIPADLARQDRPWRSACPLP
jgi:xanthine/CO dehydrogenase XdhC/CoxF family maturation factor